MLRLAKLLMRDNKDPDRGLQLWLCRYVLWLWQISFDYVHMFIFVRNTLPFGLTQPDMRHYRWCLQCNAMHCTVMWIQSLECFCNHFLFKCCNLHGHENGKYATLTESTQQQANEVTRHRQTQFSKCVTCQVQHSSVLPSPFKDQHSSVLFSPFKEKVEQGSVRS